MQWSRELGPGPEALAREELGSGQGEDREGQGGQGGARLEREIQESHMEVHQIGACHGLALMFFRVATRII